MKRTTIFIDERLERELRSVAQREGRPVAALVRDAVERYVASTRRDRGGRLGFIAAGRSGRADVAERHEELLFAGHAPTRHPRKKPRRAR